MAPRGPLCFNPSVLAFTLCALACAAYAQRLDLPTRLPPPSLDGDTYVSRLVGTLEVEIDELALAERSMPSDRRGYARGAIDTRLLAIQLLAGHEGTGPRVHARTLAGLRLAHGRETLDDMIDRAARLDARAAASALDALWHFNAALVDHAAALRGADVINLDVILPRVIAPLARAGGGVLPGVPVSHWPRALSESPRAATGEATLAEDVEDLVRRFAQADVPAVARPHVETMLGFVQRGVPYPDFRPDLDRFRRVLEDVLAFIVTVDRATWMDAAQAERYRDAVVAVVVAISEPGTRRGGVHRLRRLEHSRAVIERVSALGANGEDTRALERALVSMDVILEGAAENELHPEPPPESSSDHAFDPPPALGRLAAVLDDMMIARASDNTELPRDLRPAFGKLKRSCRVAERALLDELAAFADKDAASDPAVLSLIADHAQYAEDIARLRRLPEIMTAMDAMSAGSAKAVRLRVRRICGHLTDPGRRADAVRALDRLERRVAAARALPFETSLRNGDGPAVVAAGGRHLELLDTIAAARGAWVEAWADAGVRGDAEEPAARRLDLLVRLVRLMSDSAGAFEVEGTGITIDRWAGWGLSRRLMQRAATDLPNRLKLATISANEGDDPALAEQLDRIEREAPLVRLVGRLADVLGEALGGLPEGARGLLGQLVHPPSRDALLGDQRLRVAELCRYTIEAAFAWDEGRDERGRELQRYVNALAEEIRAAIE